MLPLLATQPALTTHRSVLSLVPNFTKTRTANKTPGAVADRHGTRPLASLGFLFALPTPVLLRFITNHMLSQTVLFCVLLFLVGGSIALISVPLTTEVSHVVSDEEEKNGEFEEAALACGFHHTCAFAAGSLAGPLWGGMMVEHLGWGTMGWSLGLLCGVTAVPTVLFWGRMA